MVDRRYCRQDRSMRCGIPTMSLPPKNLGREWPSSPAKNSHVERGSAIESSRRNDRHDDVGHFLASRNFSLSFSVSIFPKVGNFCKFTRKSVFEFAASCARATAKIGHKDEAGAAGGRYKANQQHTSHMTFMFRHNMTSGQ